MLRSFLEQHKTSILWLYAAGVLVLLMIPTPSVPAVPGFPLDKVAHLILFGGVAGLTDWNLTGVTNTWRRGSWAFTGAAAYAGAIEVVQAGLPYRSFELMDWVAGGMGALVAALLGRFVFREPRV